MLSAAQYLTFGSAVAILFSIAASQILLALALVALLLSKAPLRLPRIWLPLGLFLLLTLVSLAFSGDVAHGLPQVRKIYVYSMLLVVFSTLRDMRMIRWLFLAWAGVGALEAARGLVQFAAKVSEARALGMDFGAYYEPERITGFMSHWMTFGGEEMFVLIMLTAYLFFSPSARKRGFWLFLLCFGLLCAALLLGWTRSIWIATAVAGLYLIWFWKRWLIALAPVILLLAFFAGPDFVRTRMRSIFHAHDRAFRVVTWRTGLRMVQAHPWLGLGPEQVNRESVVRYLPPDVHEPLPEGWYGHLHNIYLHYAAERGIPALLALLWMLLMMLTDFWRALRRLPPGPSDRRFVLHGAIAVIIATMVAGMFEHNLGDSEVLTMFLVVAACGYVAVEKDPPLPDSLAGKELVLVGGTGGLGAASTELLAETGSRLTITYRSRQDRAGEFEKFGRIVQADITKAGDRGKLLDASPEIYGLVVFAGDPARARSSEELESAMRLSMEVNYMGPILLAREAADRMKSRKVPGSIVLISTMQAVALFPGSTAYAGAKIALLHAARILAKECRGPANIRVNVISPGVIAAGMAETSIAAGKYDRYRDEGIIQRFGHPRDIARAVRFFLEPDNYVTGQVLSVDGGLTL